MAQRQSTTSEGTIIQINEAQIKDHLGEIVRGTVQDTLNALLDRLVHNAHRIHLKGESMRKRKASLTQKEEMK